MKASIDHPALRALASDNRTVIYLGKDSRVLGAVTVQVYDIPYENHNIWGATAGMLTALYKLLRTE